MTAAQRRALVAILVAAFALRLGWALGVRPEAPWDWADSGDQFSYYHYGGEIARGRGYVSYINGHATAYYPIGYPALLGALYFIALHTPITNDLMLVTALFHVVLGTVSVLLAFVVGRAMAGVRTGLLAAAVLAGFPNLIYQVSSVQLETTFIFLVLAALAVIVTHDWAGGPPSVRRLLAFGAALGVAVLVRPFAAVLLVGLAGALIAVGVRWRRVALLAAVPVAVIVVMSVPWTIRNAVQLHAFVPSSTNMGDTLCIDRNLDAKGGFRFADHDGCVDPNLPEVERNTGNTKKAISFVIHHPGRELLQIVRRGRIMFAGDHDGIEAVQTLGAGKMLTPRTVDATQTFADLYFFGVLALAVLGLPTFVRRDGRPARLLALSGLVGLLVIPLLLWGNPRFHLPLAPFMALSAAGALETAWRWLDRRRAKPVG
jgi:4-amino-4-deoxy-L-arabinose transferase-like glycosyltransferase